MDESTSTETLPDFTGPLDRLRNGVDLLRLFNSGLVSEVLDIVRLVPGGMWGEALVDVGDILEIEKLPTEATAVRKLGTALIPRPYAWNQIIDAGCDLQKMLLLRFALPQLTPSDPNDPNGPIRMLGTVGARKRVGDMKEADFAKWMTNNAAKLKEGRDRLRRILAKRAPEVLDALDGKPMTMAMTPERAEQIIRRLDFVIFIASAIGMFYPPALLISTLLRGVQTYLKSKYPEVNALPDFMAEAGEIFGASLESIAAILGA